MQINNNPLLLFFGYLAWKSGSRFRFLTGHFRRIKRKVGISAPGGRTGNTGRPLLPPSIYFFFTRTSWDGLAALGCCFCFGHILPLLLLQNVCKLYM